MARSAQAPAWPAAARWLRRHRRLLSALLLAGAAGTVVHAALPEPAGASLVTVAHDLPAGHLLSDADLATTTVPHAAVPDAALGAEALVGARLASAVRAGEAVTDARLSGAGLVSALPPGQAAVPVLLAAQARPWLAVGQRVRLQQIDTGQAWAPAPAVEESAAEWRAGGEPVVEQATVLDVADPASTGVLTGAAAPDTGGVTALVQVAEGDAARLAAAPGPVAAVLLGPP